MDELNEAYLDRMISRMKSSFDNLSEFDKIEYVKRIKNGLSEVLDDSFYKMFKDNYREMGNNYIDRDTIKEIASEYREVVEYIHDIRIEKPEDRVTIIKELEDKLKKTSFYRVQVSDYDEDSLKQINWTSITITFQPLRGMGIFQIYLSFNGVDNVLQGLENVSMNYQFKNDIETYDIEHSEDEYIKDEFGQTKSVKSKDLGWDKETNLV